MRRVCASTSLVSSVQAMTFVSLPDLMKPKGALATLPTLLNPVEDGFKPVITGKQLNLHYNKHHKAYVDKLNDLAKDKYDGLTIEEIVKKTAGKSEEKVLFNQAAQHFNHSFFWKCLVHNGKPMPKPLEEAIVSTFGSVENFKKDFEAKAVGNFGSGWTWLVADPKTGKLSIENTSNAGCPVVDGKAPLFTVDVWEHAYYVDFENRRPDYMKEIWQIVNWEFVAHQFAGATKN